MGWPETSPYPNLGSVRQLLRHVGTPLGELVLLEFDSIAGKLEARIQQKDLNSSRERIGIGPWCHWATSVARRACSGYIPPGDWRVVHHFCRMNPPAIQEFGL